MNFFKAFPEEKRLPGLQRLYGGRWSMSRLVSRGDGSELVAGDLPANSTEHTFEASVAELAQITAAGITPSQFKLVDIVIGGGESGELSVLYKYETFTSTWTDEEAPVVDYELNGLKRVTKKMVAVKGTANEFVHAGGATPSKLSGVSPAANDPILAQIQDRSTDYAERLTLVYLAPGVISKAEQPGPVPGTISHSWLTWVLDATDATAMATFGGVIPGVLVEKKDDNWQGYKVRAWQSVGGTITGVKYTYKDVVDVRIPGTVELTTQAVTVTAAIGASPDSLTGTIAIAKVTPSRSSNVAATVTVEITTTPPGTASVAYDLGAVSCSVTGLQTSYNYRGFDFLSTIGGTVTLGAPRRSANIGASIQNYPGCYLVAAGGGAYTQGTAVTGTFNYVAGTQFERSSGGTIVTGTALTSAEANTLIGTGSTSANGYTTTGVIQRRGRPVFTALNGTTYYEVITWSTP